MSGKSQGHASVNLSLAASSSDKATKSSTIGAASGASTAAPKSSGIDREAWLKALHEDGIESAEDDQDATTVDEFVALMGMKRETAERRLRQLEAAGKATRTRKLGRSSDGRIVRYIAYRLIP